MNRVKVLLLLLPLQMKRSGCGAVGSGTGAILLNILEFSHVIMVTVYIRPRTVSRIQS